MSGIDYSNRFASSVDEDVKVEIDESKISHSHYDESWIKEQKRLDKESLKLVAKGNRGLGIEASLGRDERMMKLKSLVKQGKVLTVISGSNALHVSEGKIIEYAKEMKLHIFDTRKNDWVKIR